MGGARVLYLGDGELAVAARYLAAVLTRAGIEFDHRSSATPCADALLDAGHGAYVLSDYPSCNFTPAQLERLARRVRDGAGLLAIGGWASFVGANGGYQATALAPLLPVELEAGDDRTNSSGPCVVEPGTAHPLTEGLPLDRDLPVVGGFNRLSARAGATVVLTVRQCRVDRAPPDGLALSAGTRWPLLVLGAHGRGRVACFASDVAPHWVGGLVDWGAERITARAPGAPPVEVGACYAELFERLVRWVAAGRADAHK